MIATGQRNWFAPNFPSMAQQYCSSCPICLAHNIGQRVKTTPAAHPPPWGPFVNLQIDFVQLPKCCSYEYILVIIDVFSGWVEAYPCIRADSITVAKKLLKEFIPKFGLPLTIDSNRGTHFTGQIVKNICQALNIQQHLHCSYHPQSSGAVERKNSDLKTRISKICAETGLKWPDALPIALMLIRNTVNRKHGLTPYKILMARPIRMPATPTVAPHQTDLQLTDETVLNYCKALIKYARSVHSQVQEALPQPPDVPCHNLEPGDWIYVKVTKRELTPRTARRYHLHWTPKQLYSNQGWDLSLRPRTKTLRTSLRQVRSIRVQVLVTSPLHPTPQPSRIHQLKNEDIIFGLEKSECSHSEDHHLDQDQEPTLSVLYVT
ncbi:protein NYNRIN-like isoform X2 [Alligator mississippiensis]|uniref:protein NYNRIN-like isoform X2 n=1 Tax=Alligator mississippiensis TaxID=8496 RepID=UPI002877A375|nr:protein NYNRIN-like isoform X2 [Alligator mississippiensis]